MRIDTYIEHNLEPATHAEIAELRRACFPEDESGRSYFKQLPHFRLLARDDSSKVIGHLGVDHRMMTFGGQVAAVFGAIDLCVAEGSRRKGIAGSLLAELERLARRSGVDVLFLVASDKRLYQRCGFEDIDAHCSWLRIDEHANYGVASEEIVGELMIKPLNSEFVPTGPIDFLGYLF